MSTRVTELQSWRKISVCGRTTNPQPLEQGQIPRVTRDRESSPESQFQAAVRRRPVLSSRGARLRSPQWSYDSKDRSSTGPLAAA